MQTSEAKRKKITTEQDQLIKQHLIHQINNKLKLYCDELLTFSATKFQIREQFNKLMSEKQLTRVFEMVAEQTQMDKKFIYKHFYNTYKNNGEASTLSISLSCSMTCSQIYTTANIPEKQQMILSNPNEINLEEKKSKFDMTQLGTVIVDQNDTNVINQANEQNTDSFNILDFF